MPLYSFFIITVTTEVVINVTIKVIIYLGLLCSVAAVVFFRPRESFTVIIGWNRKHWKRRFVAEIKWTSELYFVLTGTCLGKLTTADRPREWGRHNFMAISDRIVFCIPHFSNILVFAKSHNTERRTRYSWYYAKQGGLRDSCSGHFFLLNGSSFTGKFVRSLRLRVRRRYCAMLCFRRKITAVWAFEKFSNLDPFNFVREHNTLKRSFSHVKKFCQKWALKV